MLPGSPQDEGEKMGISLKNKSWTEVVAKNKEEDRKHVKKGATPRFPEPEIFPDTGNIRSTKQTDELIRTRMTPKSESGTPIVHTARGRRRVQRLGK